MSTPSKAFSNAVLIGALVEFAFVVAGGVTFFETGNTWIAMALVFIGGFIMMGLLFHGMKMGGEVDAG